MIRILPPLPLMIFAAATVVAASSAHAQVRVILKSPAASSEPAASAAPSVAPEAPAVILPAAAGPAPTGLASGAPVSETAPEIGPAAVSGDLPQAAPLASEPRPAMAERPEPPRTRAIASEPPPPRRAEKPASAGKAAAPSKSGGLTKTAEASLYEPTAEQKPSRRGETPTSFRERCVSDGGALNGGGKFGFCVLR